MKKALPIFLALILAHVASIALGAQNRSGAVTLTIDLSTHASGQDARLWLPYPVTDAHQIISDISVTGDFVSSGVYTDSAFGTPILYAEWPAGVKSRMLTFSFAVVRQEIRQT